MVSPVRCREIEISDLDRVIPLLTRGFDRPRDYWVRAVDRLTARRAPPGMPRFGYVLDADDNLVGVLLLICTSVTRDGETRIRCNLSSWYVDPTYRMYGSVLAQRAAKNDDVTYFNVSPARHTWGILEAQGFARFADGRTVTIPALSPPRTAAQVWTIRPDMPRQISAGSDLEQGEITLLLDHADLGCLSLVCETAEGRRPFVFGLHRRSGIIPVAHLVYCRDLDDFVRLARPIGQHLLRRGYGFVNLASNGPIEGLVGRYAGARPWYFKGPHQPRIGDVAYSEQVIFGY
jgi:hypothetical protein